jgi:hypothetical protein
MYQPSLMGTVTVWVYDWNWPRRISNVTCQSPGSGKTPADVV